MSKENKGRAIVKMKSKSRYFALIYSSPEGTDLALNVIDNSVPTRRQVDDHFNYIFEDFFLSD
jgi:hypothetical protein